MNIRIPFAPTPLLDLSPFYAAAQPPPGRPIIPVTMTGRSDADFDCLVDSGSVATVLPRAIASHLGIKISENDVDGKPFSQLRWRGQQFTRAWGEVGMEVTEPAGRDGFAWTSGVWFCDLPVPYLLLGCQSFLEFFVAIFHIGDGYLELTPRIGAAVAEVHRG